VGSASAFAASSNNTIDATHHAYWTPALNAHGTLNSFTVKAQDNHGDLSTTAVQSQVSVNSVNDIPSISAIPTDITVIEETLSDVNLSAAILADNDMVDEDYTLILTVSTGMLQASSNGSVTVAGSGSSTLTLNGSMSHINSFLNTAGNIQYTGANFVSGDNAAIMSVWLNDEDGSGAVHGASINIDITELVENINVTITDNTTLETGNLGTNEGTFNVVLTSRPVSSVTIDLLSDDSSEGNVSSPASKQLFFTTNNWNQVQNVTVTGNNDNIKDGDITFHINLNASSSDTEYDGKTAQASLINVDDDIMGLMVTTTDATTDESGATGGFNVVLKSKPMNDVTVSLTSSDSSEGMVTTPADKTLVFNSHNWNTPQNAIVSGIDDYWVDATVNYLVTLSTSSADSKYHHLIYTVSLSNADNDTAGLSVGTPSSSITSETGSSSTYDITLNSQPVANVSIALSSNDETEGSVTPVSVNFTPSDWNMLQTITVTGLDDSDLDGSQNYSITIVSTSNDSDYNGLTDTKNFSNSDNETDLDLDRIHDGNDNCPNMANPTQGDHDNDGIGDVCDSTDNSTEPVTPVADGDNDGIADAVDNCINDANFNQSDVDGDGVGDICDTTSVTIGTPTSIDLSNSFAVTPNNSGNSGGSTQNGTSHVTLAIATMAITNPTNGTTPVVSNTVTLTVQPAMTPPQPKSGEPTPPDGMLAPVNIIAINPNSDENGYVITVAFTIEEGSDKIFSGYWKYGKESANDIPHWYDLRTLVSNATIPDRKRTGYSILADGKTILVTLVDGLRADDDLSVNGRINDPGAPVIKTAVKPSVNPIPIISPIGYILLVLMIGLIASRRFKKPI